MVRDFYHRYTVDEHTLVTIDTAVHVSEEPFASLATEIAEREGLVFTEGVKPKGIGAKG